MSVKMRAAGWTMSSSCSCRDGISKGGQKAPEKAGTHLHDGGTVVSDCLLAILVDEQQVAAIGPEGALDG